MSPTEMSWLMAHKSRAGMYGNQTAAEVADLYETAYGSDDDDG